MRWGPERDTLYRCTLCVWIESLMTVLCLRRRGHGCAETTPLAGGAGSLSTQQTRHVSDAAMRQKAEETLAARDGPAVWAPSLRYVTGYDGSKSCAQAESTVVSKKKFAMIACVRALTAARAAVKNRECPHVESRSAFRRFIVRRI